ncbi:hypothetical protein Tco_1138650 [Tanacetum coccineum]
MEKTRFKPKELLPYGMLLTRLFKHVVSVSPELAFDHYLSHDRAMHLLAPHYERMTRADQGKKRPRESNVISSFSTLNHPSSSHPLDDSIDENDDESFHSNPSSLSQNISSLLNDVFRVHQNPPHESHYLNTYLSKTINLQTQQIDAHREGLSSIGQALKNMMGGKWTMNQSHERQTGDGAQRTDMTTHDIEALHARAEAAEQRAKTLHVSLGAARMDVKDLIESCEAERLEMAEIWSRAQDIEAIF